MAAAASACKSRMIAMSAATLAALAFPPIATADPPGLARPSANAAPGSIVTVKGSCVAEKQAFAASADTQSTTSENPTNLVGATLKPTITKGCLVVDFSADSFAQNANIVYAWVLLDGTPMAPGQINLSGNDDPANSGAWPRAHAFSFVATGISSGPHTVQVQFFNLDNTHQVLIEGYTLVAHYD